MLLSLLLQIPAPPPLAPAPEQEPAPVQEESAPLDEPPSFRPPTDEPAGPRSAVPS